MPWLTRAAEGVRRRLTALAPDDWSDHACRIRQEALDVDVWETRRRGRPVRLWSAQLSVRTAAVDSDDAGFRVGELARPRHRIGTASGLCSVAGPVEWPSPDVCGGVAEADGEEAAALLRLYPAAALADGTRWDREVMCRVHAADHAAALEMAGRGVRRLVAPGLIPSGLRCWQARQRVLFLAGPGDAPARADELAATVVDARGGRAATVLSVQEEAGRRDPVDGHVVHPAYDVGPFGAEALWDDFDADPRDPGDPDVVSSLLLRAAVEIRTQFGLGTANSAIHMNANLCNPSKITYPR